MRVGIDNIDGSPRGQSLDSDALGEISRSVGIIAASERREVPKKLPRQGLRDDIGRSDVGNLDEIVVDRIIEASHANDVTSRDF